MNESEIIQDFMAGEGIRWLAEDVGYETLGDALRGHILDLTLRLERAERTKNARQNTPPSAEKCIEHFAHCGLCLAAFPPGESPESYARLSVGFTQHGVQVWCVRHNCNVMHIDFEGHKHPATTTRAE